MAIEFVRIDDRLIHGQVATTWIGLFNIQQVLIINDEVVNDKVQQSIISMTAPTNVTVKIFGIDQFVNIYKTNKITKRTMIIITNSIDALRLKKGGVDFENLNVGGMRFKIGKRVLTKSISVTKDEEDAFQELINIGVNCEAQMVPNDVITNIKEVI